MSEWQPIETAPKHGRVLVCITTFDELGAAMRRVAIGQRGPATEDWGIEDWPRYAVREGRLPVGFVTHWQPLPETPRI